MLMLLRFAKKKKKKQRRNSPQQFSPGIQANNPLFVSSYLLQTFEKGLLPVFLSTAKFL